MSSNHRRYGAETTGREGDVWLEASHQGVRLGDTGDNFERVHEVAKILLPWPNWGKGGMGTISRHALEAYIDRGELRAVEPVLKPAAPFAGGMK